jgi:integrase
VLPTIHRKPFSADELSMILKAAKSDPYIYPAVVIAACTAMRRGDCCLLLRSSVNLKDDFIRVKTIKTGEMAEIPVFALLREVLAGAPGTNTRAPSSRRR